jgi:DNA ligase-4
LKTNGDLGHLTIAEVDNLLDELASTCPFSDTTLRARIKPAARSKLAVLRTLYDTLPATDAQFLTQIILKDLRPVLYPVPAPHYTAALKQFNASSVQILTKEDAMRAWDESGGMLKVYRVRSDLDEASRAFENGEACGGLMPIIGTPIEARNWIFPMRFSSC